MPPFLDTNILLYAFSDDRRSVTAKSLLATPHVISVQVLNEFASAGHRKFKMTWDEINVSIAAFHETAARVVPLTVKLNFQAILLAERYRLSFYDALIVAAALEAGSEELLSEDMQDGMVIAERLTIRNPFKP